ncbi:MAG: tetratricopeptide repeat protein, partial [bacterium]
MGLVVLWLTLASPVAAAWQAPAEAGGAAQRFERALAATRDGRLQEALTLWSVVVEATPGDAAAWSTRGNVRLMLGDPEGAIADQTRAMEIDPAHLDPHLNRGTAEEALGRWQEAAADYRWILARDPQEAAALYN